VTEEISKGTLNFSLDDYHVKKFGGNKKPHKGGQQKNHGKPSGNHPKHHAKHNGFKDKSRSKPFAGKK